MHANSESRSPAPIYRELPQQVTMKSLGMWVAAGAFDNPEDTWFIDPRKRAILRQGGQAWKLDSLICHVGGELWMRVQKYPGGPKLVVVGPVVEAIARIQPDE